MYKNLFTIGLVSQSIAKRDFSQPKRNRMADTGTAMSDGSFPIVSREDLLNAIRLAGMAKNPAKAREHIIARANAIGASKLIPRDWNK